MGYANKEGTYWTDQSLAEDFQGEALEVRHLGCGVLALVWAAAAATDAVVKLQESVDKTTWIDIASQTVTIAAATGSHIFKLTDAVLLSPYIRAVVVDNSESAGTATIKYFFKGDR